MFEVDCLGRGDESLSEILETSNKGRCIFNAIDKSVSESRPGVTGWVTLKGRDKDVVRI